MSFPVQIDGSQGGGAIVRVAVGLSAATQRRVEITGIRESRPNPGLRPQHLAGVNAVATLTDADVKYGDVGSSKLVFEPHKLQETDIRIDISTAGSVGLALQPLQIALLNRDMEVNITVDGGATVGKWAPPTPYLKHVMLPVFEQFGHQQELTVKRHGFYPEGGALVKATIGPSSLEPIDYTERGELTAVHGVSLASTHLKDAEVAERQRTEARRILANKHPSLDMNIDTAYVETKSPGSCIVLWAETDTGAILGADDIGEKGKRAEVVGKEAATALLGEFRRNAPLDRWLSDQIIPLLGVAGGRIRVSELTDHVKHNLAVTEKFVDRTLTGDEEEGIIEAK